MSVYNMYIWLRNSGNGHRPTVNWQPLFILFTSKINLTPAQHNISDTYKMQIHLLFECGEDCFTSPVDTRFHVLFHCLCGFHPVGCLTMISQRSLGSHSLTFPALHLSLFIHPFNMILSTLSLHPFTICAYWNQIMQCINVSLPVNIILNTSITHSACSLTLDHSKDFPIRFVSTSNHFVLCTPQIYVRSFTHPLIPTKYHAFSTIKLLLSYVLLHIPAKIFNGTMFQHISPPRLYIPSIFSDVHHFQFGGCAISCAVFFVFVGLFISDFDVGTLNVGSNECALLRLCLQINTKQRIALTLSMAADK